MTRVSARAILLDVEGTTSSISYVTDVLFPYARQRLGAFLAGRWDDPDVRAACDQVARDVAAASPPGADTSCDVPADVQARLIEFMDRDVKATGLKAIQGLIWKDGFESGELKAHVFPDVPAALRRWHEAGTDVRIYSSGSVLAQRQFFGHTEAGDLLSLLRGHYDTTTGPKRDPASYTRIASDIGLPPGDILFVSDVPAELDAAALAGMTTILSVRPGNPPVPADVRHTVITAFDQIELAGPAKSPSEHP